MKQALIRTLARGIVMEYPLHNVIGNLGVALIVGSYFLVQIGKMSATGIVYTAGNGLGAALVMYSLYFDFNLSSFIIEVFWLAISIVGVVRIYRERWGKRRSDDLH